MRLHTTVGPAQASISAVADAAGVTRLTVYRHFPDLEHLFVACSSHWFAAHPPPDPATWRDIPDLADRARQAFGQLYGWFGRNRGRPLPDQPRRGGHPSGGPRPAPGDVRALRGSAGRQPSPSRARRPRPARRRGPLRELLDVALPRRRPGPVERRSRRPGRQGVDRHRLGRHPWPTWPAPAADGRNDDDGRARARSSCPRRTRRPIPSGTRRPQQDPTVELPGANAPAIEAPGDEVPGVTEIETMAAFSYPGQKTVDRVRDGIDLDDVKDAGEWVWDKVKPKRREPAPEPIPIVLDLPPSEEETTMRSSSVAHEDPPPPPAARGTRARPSRASPAPGATPRDRSRRSVPERSG